MTDFWSRAGGPLPDLQEAWPEILPLLAERWQDARDLALLALASYKGQSKEEAPVPQPVAYAGAEGVME